MKTQLFLASVILATSIPALAGPLGEVNREVGKRQESARAADRPAPPPRHPRQNELRDCQFYTRDTNQNFGSTALVYAEPTPPNYTPAPVTLDILATYQNVSDSDGALNADLRLAHGNVALAFSSSSFFESDRLEKGDPEEQSRLTRWDLAIQGRALRVSNATELWLGIGVGQLHGTGFDALTGLSISGQLRHQLSRGFSGGLALEGGARGIMYADDINATELRAGVTASIVHIGYRYLEFNVGPPLKGPELGVSVRF